MGLFSFFLGEGADCVLTWVRFGGILCISVIRVDAFHIYFFQDEDFGFAVRNFFFHFLSVLLGFLS